MDRLKLFFSFDEFIFYNIGEFQLIAVETNDENNCKPAFFCFNFIFIYVDIMLDDCFKSTM